MGELSPMVESRLPWEAVIAVYYHVAMRAHMRAWIREHVLITSLVLTVISLALVFGATLDILPAEMLPVAPDWVFDGIPHANAGIAVIALVTMGLGYRSIREKHIQRHRRFMLIALVMFALFLFLYLYNVAITGAHPFPGPDVIYYYVYLPILVIHMVLAIICIPLLYYVVLLAATHPISAIPATNHARVARPALLLWAISFALGLVVYLQLYIIY